MFDHLVFLPSILRKTILKYRRRRRKRDGQKKRRIYLPKWEQMKHSDKNGISEFVRELKPRETSRFTKKNLFI